MNIYRCDPEKARKYCDKPERFCGRYCTMTYNSRHSVDGVPMKPEDVAAENRQNLRRYEMDREGERNERGGNRNCRH